MKNSELKSTWGKEVSVKSWDLRKEAIEEGKKQFLLVGTKTVLSLKENKALDVTNLSDYKEDIIAKSETNGSEAYILTGPFVVTELAKETTEHPALYSIKCDKVVLKDAPVKKPENKKQFTPKVKTKKPHYKNGK